MGLLDVFDPLGIFDQDSSDFSGQQIGFYNQNYKPFFDQAESEQGYQYAAAENTYQDIFDLLGEGFGDARARVGEQGRGATQGIQDVNTQNLAASQQAATDAGLSGSTAHGAANRGIASDTSRAIADLTAQLSQIYAGLDIGQAQAQAGALGGLANLQQNQAQNALGLAQSKAAASGNSVLEQAPPSIFSQILGAVGPALPFAFL